MCNEYDLDKQLDRTSDWLKFAEAKNVFAFTIVSAMLFGFFQVREVFVAQWVFYTVIMILLMTSILLLFSIQPILTIKKKIKMKGKIPAPAANLLYFKHVADLTLEEYQSELQSRGAGNALHTEPVRKSQGRNCFDDITEQIYTNAGIATRKFNLFKIACVLLYLVFILLFVTMIVQWTGKCQLFDFNLGLPKSQSIQVPDGADDVFGVGFSRVNERFFSVDMV